MLVPLLFLTVACIHLEIGAYVLYRGFGQRANRAFAAYSLGASLWIGGFGCFLLTHSDAFISLLNVGGVVILLGFLLLVVTLPEPGAVPRLHPLAYAPLAVALATAAYPHLLIERVAFTAHGVVPTQGPVFPYYAAGISGYVLLSLALLWRAYRNSRGVKRMQLQYFMLGNGTFVAIAALCDLVLPSAGIFSVNLYGPVASIIAVATTAYAIVKHELLDIRIVIQRGLIYSTVLACVTLFYLGLVAALTIAFGDAPGTYFVGAGVATIVGIFGVPFIERYFRAATDRFFFKNPYDYGAALKALSEALHRNTERAAMVRESQKILDGIFHPASIHFSEQGRVELGPKRSGDAYSAQDRRLLETFSHQAATAFERGRLYEQIKSYAGELEATVEQRTSELRAAKESQEQMMIDLSHNLQTPLTILQAKLETLERIAPQDAELKSFRHSLESLSAFIYDLLWLARLEHASEPVDKQPRDLSAFVAEIAEEIGTIAAPRGIEVRSDIEPRIRVLCDARQLRHAMMNVASNALKYMKPDGNGEIRFTVHREGSEAVVQIADNGIGIRSEDIPRVFARFHRVPRSDGMAGSGLGLPIAKRIAELNDGSIALQSRIGEGTTVRIALPIAT